MYKVGNLLRQLFINLSIYLEKLEFISLWNKAIRNITNNYQIKEFYIVREMTAYQFFVSQLLPFKSFQFFFHFCFCFLGRQFHVMNAPFESVYGGFCIYDLTVLFSKPFWDVWKEGAYYCPEKVNKYKMQKHEQCYHEKE